jgi:hypothetical protein
MGESPPLGAVPVVPGNAPAGIMNRFAGAVDADADFVKPGENLVVEGVAAIPASLA